MTTRTETVNITDGSGVLEVRGNRTLSGLFLYGKPFALNWYICDGSVGQQVLHDAAVSEEAVAHFRHLTTRGVDPVVLLAEQFGDLLQQCQSGQYLLTLEELNLPVWSQWWADEGEASWYYPDDPALIFTQTMESLNEDRILDYMLQIEAGLRPIVVTLAANDAQCEFMLDGHHKLIAYAHLGINPQRLRITSLDTRRLTLADYPPRPMLEGFDKAIVWQEQNQ